MGAKSHLGRAIAGTLQTGHDVPMEPGLGIIERAFQLASDLSSVDEIRARLKREGYPQVDAHFSSKTFRNELIRALKRR